MAVCRKRLPYGCCSVRADARERMSVECRPDHLPVAGPSPAHPAEADCPAVDGPAVDGLALGPLKGLDGYPVSKCM